MFTNARFRRWIDGVCVLMTTVSAAIGVSACNSSSAMPPPLTLPPTATPKPSNISVAFAQAGYAIDASQAEPVTAVVTNDKAIGGGVRWTVSCPSGENNQCGSMTSATSASGVADAYNAPNAVPNAVASVEVVTIEATSLADPTKFATEQIRVNPKLALVLPAPAVSAAAVGVGYTLDLTKFVQGGTAPVSLAISSGTLPAGLTLNAGMISGTPTGPAGTTIVGVKVSDASKPAMSVSWSVSISVTAIPALSITSGSPANGKVGNTYGSLLGSCRFFFVANYYGAALSASGGMGTYSWSWAAAAGSSLPPGLSVSNRFTCFRNPLTHIPARIAGVPTAAGTYHVIVTVSDSGTPAQQASTNYTITIDP
jgi:hypothetical protein